MGQSPMKYLGMPLSSTKLSKAECQCLAEKITCRIRSWMRKRLSYAVRVQLVNFVLLNMNVCWSSIIILPKVVIQPVIRVCRRFLCGTNASSNKMISFASLNQKDVLELNNLRHGILYSFGKYVWNISCKADNL